MPIPPFLLAQNAFVVKSDAIVAANGVVHLVSNLIDPFAFAIGGVLGPTREVVKGFFVEFGPWIRLAVNALT